MYGDTIFTSEYCTGIRKIGGTEFTVTPVSQLFDIYWAMPYIALASSFHGSGQANGDLARTWCSETRRD